MTKSWRLIRFSKTADKLDFLSSCKLGDACGAPLMCSALKGRTAVRGSTKLESTAPRIFSSSGPDLVQGTFTARLSWPDPVKAEKTRICREVPAATLCSLTAQGCTQLLEKGQGRILGTHKVIGNLHLICGS